MYIAAFVFAPLAAPEPAPGSDFSTLPIYLTAVPPPRSRRQLPNFPVWVPGVCGHGVHRLVATKLSQAMQTHPDIGLL